MEGACYGARPQCDAGARSCEPPPEAGTLDAGSEGGPGADASLEGGDAGTDARSDANDGGEASVLGDAAADATEAEAGIEAGTDAGSDSGASCGRTSDSTELGYYFGFHCGTFAVSQAIAGANGVIYLFSKPTRRIYAWSAVTGECHTPIPLGVSPQYAAYSRENQQLYVAYASGAITSIDASSGVEKPFASTPLAPLGLATAGKYVIGADTSGAWATHYSFAPSGTLISAEEWNYYSREYEWSEANQSLYFMRDDTSPNDVHFEHIDCATGQIAAHGESPYHGAFEIAPPVRVSPDGSRILVHGDVYDAHTLQRLVSLPGNIVAADWLSADSLLLMRAIEGEFTIVEQRSGALLKLVNVKRFEGNPVALRRSGNGAIVVTTYESDARLSTYHPNAHGDEDTVEYSQDAFPLDRAASRDTDHDGYPDSWNPGGGASSTGLTLDAFPNDAACHLASQGRSDDSSRCDIAGSIPAYTPDAIEFDGTDVIYLLSKHERRIFRYSIKTSQHLNPFVPRAEPTRMAYSSAHGRMYLAYEDGSISGIALNTGVESEFAALPYAPHGLAATGNFVLAADGSGAWNSHFTFDTNGNPITWSEWNYRSGEYAFSVANSRVYFFRDDTSPNDIHWEMVDQTSGAITSEGESAYHGDYPMQAPIRVSRDGGYVLLGTGDIFDGIQLEHQLKLPVSPIDAVWLTGNALIALTSDAKLRWFTSTFTAGKTVSLSGTPLRIFAAPAHLITVTVVSQRPVIQSVAY
ncbi:MAG TPA: hypothetical protein VK524_02010 [Polyangiaceae bacterium]|nr:hypothetical protein [Polyangiaceae bacterium]